MIKIVQRFTRAVLYSSATATTIAAAVKEANLARADLAGADLAGGLKALYIQGSRHQVIMAEPDTIRIGCISQPFLWWRENYRKIGKENSYSAVQIKEYWCWIRMARRYQLTKW